ncbi:MAG: glycosyltransferase [Candidatus Thermoplasmatota archaeon]|nr:glycosyltransferase [Candidatus Thermoplasmatota archaeon]
MMKINHAVDRTILVAGPSYWGYVKMIADGFRSCGLKATTLEWTTPGTSIIDDVKFVTSERCRILRQEAHDILNSRRLEKMVLSSNPDYVLVVKGTRISSTLARFCLSNDVTLALWAYDSAQHVPLIKEIVNDYSLAYFYESTDLMLFPNKSNTKFLPMAYDPSYYHPIHGDTENPIDICFVGSLTDYPLRRETIMKLAKSFPNLVIEVSSEPRLYYPLFWLQDYVRFGCRGKLHFGRRSLSHAEINTIYGQSRMCLNIHHTQSKKAVNPRTFEILGSGGFLMSDRRMDGIHDFEVGRDFESYISQADLIEKVQFYIDNPELMRSISNSGHERVLRNHTYQHRARSILADIDDL